MKFYRCNTCHNLFIVIDDSKVIPKCCGNDMELLVPSKVDELKEKHVPHVTMENKDTVYVEVGFIHHPMLENHYIEWILLETDKGFHLKNLKPNNYPISTIKIHNETPLRVYEYCNVHGLWTKEIDSSHYE